MSSTQTPEDGRAAAEAPNVAERDFRRVARACAKASVWVPGLLVFLGLCWLWFVFTGLDRTPIVNSEGYVQLAERSLWSAEFYFASRPFSVPLFYKLFGGSRSQIVTGQLVLSTASWLFLCGSLAHSIRSKVLKLVHCLLFPIFMVWWNIMGWNFAVRGESITLSWLALWIASLVLYLRKPGGVRVAFLCATTVLFCQCRDSVPLIVVPTLMAILVAELCNRTKSKRRATYAAVVAAVALSNFSLQAYTSQHVRGDRVETRHEFPFLNVMLQRILPDSTRSQWFEQHGMPIHPELLGWKKRWASGNRWALFREQRYEALMSWVREDSKSVYARYLLSHPGYVYDLSWRERAKLFPTDLEDYTHAPPSRGPFTLAKLVFPLLGASLAGLLALAGVVRSLVGRVPALLPISSLMVFLVLVHAVLVVCMDAMEVPRHELLNVPWLHLAVYIGFLAWVSKRPGLTWERPRIAAGAWLWLAQLWRRIASESASWARERWGRPRSRAA